MHLFKNKKGQAAIELGFGMMLIAGLMFYIFDIGVIMQAKAESLMMARNGVRYVIINGISRNQEDNVKVQQQAVKHIENLYYQMHNTPESQKAISLPPSSIRVENTRTATDIKNDNTASNPVLVEVCLQAHPMGSIAQKTSKIGSAYVGYHSSTFDKKKGE